jgi:hypothetical protein
MTLNLWRLLLPKTPLGNDVLVECVLVLEHRQVMSTLIRANASQIYDYRPCVVLMGYYAYLIVGKKYKFSSVKYRIPYSWSMIFDNSSDSDGVYKTDANSANSKLYFTGLTVDELEEHISQYSERNARWWREHRDYVHREGREAVRFLITLFSQISYSLFSSLFIYCVLSIPL